MTHATEVMAWIGGVFAIASTITAVIVGIIVAMATAFKD